MTRQTNSANHAKLLLNKIVEDGDATVLARHNIMPSDMPTGIDSRAYDFITSYAADNEGHAPSYALLVDTVKGFDYIPSVSDSYAYLTKQVKGFAAKQRILSLFETGEFERNLNELDGNAFVTEYLPQVLSDIKSQTSVRKSVGVDIKSGVDTFLSEYEKRKSGDSFKTWQSRYSAIGSYTSGNLYTVIGESGRGKSVFTLEDAIYAALQGANVLLWTLEMAQYEVMVRIYTSLSADAGVTKRLFNGVNMDAGFDAKSIRQGSMTEEYEDAFKTFLRNINDYVPGNITIRAVDDDGFNDRSLRALESDIIESNADYVVIDPFYYLQYERNTSKTAGGDAAETSKKLRSMTGRLSVVTIAITQSELSDDESSEERELRIPKRSEVKKTKALLEDAAILVGVDSNYLQGNGVVGILKGRDGGEGNVSNVIYLPQFGIVRELEADEQAAQDFNF